MSLNKSIPTDWNELPHQLKKLHEYWQSKCKNQNFALAIDINFNEILPLLPHINLIRLDHDTNRFYFQFFGTNSIKKINKDLTGHYVDQLPSSEAMIERYQTLIKNHQPYIHEEKFIWSKLPYKYTGVCLPLSQNGEEIDTILSGIDYQFDTDFIHEPAEELEYIADPELKKLLVNR